MNSPSDIAVGGNLLLEASVQCSILCKCKCVVRNLDEFALSRYAQRITSQTGRNGLIMLDS